MPLRAPDRVLHLRRSTALAGAHLGAPVTCTTVQCGWSLLKEHRNLDCRVQRLVRWTLILQNGVDNSVKDGMPCQPHLFRGIPLGIVAMVTILGCLVNALNVLAQSETGRAPVFEVASVKPSKPGSRFSIVRSPGGRLTVTNATLRMLVKAAYHLKDYQLSGGLNWVDSERFDIVAKPEGGGDEIAPMLRSLLADRFKLTVRRETKELPVYALVPARNGPKLRDAKTGDSNTGGTIGRGHLTGHKMSIPELADVLSGSLDRTVLDRTGIQGVFDIELEWTPDVGQQGGDGRGNTEPSPDPSGPSIFAALQRQLGLRLEAQKGPVEVVVIDSASKPPEN
jgi:uncharacterized protein (TIGR03435 family)